MLTTLSTCDSWAVGGQHALSIVINYSLTAEAVKSQCVSSSDALFMVSLETLEALC